MAESEQDREFIELLNELRVALPGVQVLFAFLLVVPFSQRFEELGSGDRAVFTASVVAAALSAACLIAPTAQHRILWRQHHKEQLLRIATWLALVGTGLLAVTMSAVIWLTVDLIYGNKWAAAITALVVGVFLVLWYAVPVVLLMRRRT